MIERLSGKHVVLLGIGHTNAHVLRMWKMDAIPNADLTCISDNSIATYSGMLPALLAGQIPRERMEIDLVRLCSSVGARLITDPVTGIDHQKSEVRFADRPPVAFDVLSVGIGSTSSTKGLSIEGDSLVKIKPMQSFLQRLTVAIEKAEQRSDRERLRAVIVGSGVAGIEIGFCLPSYVAAISKRPLSLHLVTRSDVVLPEVEPRTRALVAAELDRRGVQISTGRSVTQVRPDSVGLDDGSCIDADFVIWATGAVPPKLIGKLDLELDDRGFIATDHTLRCRSTRNVFAVGDTGTIIDEGLPKAGVYAVRQGPVLWENIQRTLDGLPLQKYKPQRTFLKLINLGDGRAIGQWKRFAFSGRWVMRFKNWIDGRFIDMYQVGAMSSDAAGDSMGDTGTDEMQCRGCGCKLGSDVLQSALTSDSQLAMDDAAEIGGDSGVPLVASTDFFTAPVDDPFLAGRIAALHSASDIIATGATVTEALANVVLPNGDRPAQQRTLQDFLSGAGREFRAMDAKIVGGHTIVGPRMETGFTVIGRPLGPSLIRKGNLRAGDRLYLTKPLGIGVLLAAHLRSMCPARDYDALLEAMLQQQHRLAQAAIDVGIDAGTDVTGFGLAGHLIEMLSASGVSAVIHLDDVPILPGAIELVDRGIESSLAPDNRKVESAISVADSIRPSAKYKILFDPQTCGGLLLGVDDDNEDRFVRAVSSVGLPQPVCIGQVLDRQAALLTIELEHGTALEQKTGVISQN